MGSLTGRVTSFDFYSYFFIFLLYISGSLQSTSCQNWRPDPGVLNLRPTSRNLNEAQICSRFVQVSRRKQRGAGLMCPALVSFKRGAGIFRTCTGHGEIDLPGVDFGIGSK